MSLFGNMTNEGMDVEAEDRLGGFQIFDSDIYNTTIKMAYSITAPSGARAIFFEFDLGTGSTYRETVYFTSRSGVNFYLTENKKKAPLPGFTLVDDICMFTTDTPLAGQNTEEKVVKVYDTDSKKEVPKSVPVLVDLLGKQVSIGVVRNLENKNEKVGNEYVPTAETRETNNIEKAFHTDTKLTIVEAKAGKTVGEFWDKWLEKNKGQTRDRRKHKGGPASGRPNAGPPQSGGGSAGPTAAPARTSLFNKKT
jgi:hypothetical protein